MLIWCSLKEEIVKHSVEGLTEVKVEGIKLRCITERV